MSDVLRFSVNKPRDPAPGEQLYWVELADGRDALIVAESVSAPGSLVFTTTGGEVVLALASGTWRSVRTAGPDTVVQLADPPPPPEKPERQPRKPRSTRRQKPTRLPDDWMPPHELIEELTGQFPDVHQKGEFARFTKYYRELPGDEGERADWSLCWRRWVERAAENLGRNGA